MTRKRSLLIIILLVASGLQVLLPTPIAMASSITVSISHSYDDVWMTEAGNIFSNTFMVMMLDNEIGIQSFLRFQNLSISKSAKINYATLRVYVAEPQETPDPGSLVTIYGIDEADCAPFTSDGSVWSLSRPYTSASVNWNTTVWTGYHSVNVTDIVKEIINQYAWSSGNDLGLQILGASDSGHWPRSFEDYYHAYHEGQAELTIVYDVAPDTPPGLPPGAEFSETYGEWDIWVVDLLGDNRTGEGADVNWNLLNVTGLTEKDSGSDLTKQNATWITASHYQDQAIGCIYNDTGSANIETFFVRFMVNVTNVNNGATGNAIIPGFCGLSTVTPDGVNGLPYGASGEWVGLISWCKDDDQSWRFSLHERSGAGKIQSGYSQWFNEGTGNMLYVEFRVSVSGATKWMGYDVYDDPEFTNSIYNAVKVLEMSIAGPFRYPQITMSLGDGIGHYIVYQYYTFLESPLEDDMEYFATDENGTVVDTWTQEGENFTDIGDLKDFVDDYVDPQGGDPLDPDPGTQGWDTEGPFTRFKTRLYILVIGLGCVFMPLWAMAYKKFDAVGYAGCFIIMVLGVGLLWSITGI